jgi:hypothetical protein
MLIARFTHGHGRGECQRLRLSANSAQDSLFAILACPSATLDHRYARAVALSSGRSTRVGVVSPSMISRISTPRRFIRIGTNRASASSFGVGVSRPSLDGIGNLMETWMPAALLIDGVQVEEGQVANLLRILSSTGMDLGRSLSPINADYQTPFKYPGRILSAVFELPTGPQDREIDAQVRAAMTRQQISIEHGRTPPIPLGCKSLSVGARLIHANI